MRPCVSVPAEQYEKAIECAKTFLLFHPDDEVMKQNLAYYSAMLGEDKAAAIAARQVLACYITTQHLCSFVWDKIQLVLCVEYSRSSVYMLVHSYN